MQASPTPSEDPSRQALGRPRVVYLMGSGRSGSTILGIALGNCEGFFYAGELDNWLTRSGVPSIGGSERTRFWNAVRERVDAEELFGGESLHKLERSGSLFRLRGLAGRRRLRARWQRVTAALYDALAREASAEYIVDTAHFPLRARELQRLESIELHLVLLVREPQSVVGSFLRNVNRNDSAQRRRLTLSTNVNLWLTHLLSVIVFMRQPAERRMLLRHEDFLADPAAVLGEIIGRLGSHAPLPELSSLQTGIPIRGNRLLHSETVALRPGAERPEGRSRLTAVLQAPWSAVFARLKPAVGEGAPDPAAVAAPR
jgi:Sulfotransferase family